MARGIGLIVVAGCGFSGHGATPTDDAPIDARVVDGPIVDVGDATEGPQYKVVTIRGDHVTGTLTKFPVLIDIVDPQLAAAIDGVDVWFSDEANAPLKFERVVFDKQATRLVAWVLVPSLAAGTDTPIRLHYGAVLDHDRADPKMLWEQAGYEAVWHLDAAAPFSDATTHSHTLTPRGAPMATPGKIREALRFNGTTDQVSADQNAMLDPIGNVGTISTWINFDVAQTTQYQRILLSSNHFAGDKKGFEWAIQGGTGDYYFYPSNITSNNMGPLVLTPKPFANATWHHTAVSIDYPTKHVALFVDGVELPNTRDELAGWGAAGKPDSWWFGGDDNNEGVIGMLDEIRVAKVLHGQAWHMTEFVNQRAPQEFVIVSAAMPEP